MPAVIDEDRCGVSVDPCPNEAITVSRATRKASVNTACNSCGDCADDCLADAFTIVRWQ